MKPYDPIPEGAWSPRGNNFVMAMRIVVGLPTTVLLAVAALALIIVAGAQTTATTEAAQPLPPRSIAEERAVLENGRLSARRKALARLATHPDREADQILLELFDRYESRELPPAIWLDLFEAAAKRDHPALKARLAEREQKLAQAKDAVSRFRECLEGGDGEAGRAIFTKTPEAGCIRCHTVDGAGGEIGPDLTWLRNSMDRALILESIVSPNSTIATGFASAMLILATGETISGVVSHESPEAITITSVVDGKKRTVKIADVLERTPLPSPMPPHFGTVLDRRAIRDLVEFIAAGE